MVMKTLPRGSGQQTSEDSAPVVLSSDSTLPLPTGAATESTLSSIDTWLSDLDLESLTAAQKTLSNLSVMLTAISVIMGWDGSDHREIAVDNTGAFRLAAADIASIGAAVGKPVYTAADQIRRDCSTANLTASADTTIIASTSAATRISIFNGTGVSMILKVDSVQQIIVPPGGISEDLVIAASKVLTLNPYTTCTDGEIVINTFA